MMANQSLSKSTRRLLPALLLLMTTCASAAAQGGGKAEALRIEVKRGTNSAQSRAKCAATRKLSTFSRRRKGNS